MKFSGVDFEKVKVFQKLFPQYFKVDQVFTTFRPYSIKNHFFYESCAADLLHKIMYTFRERPISD